MAREKVVIIERHKGNDNKIHRVGDVAEVDTNYDYGLAEDDEKMLRFNGRSYAVATPEKYFRPMSWVKKIISRQGRKRKIIWK